MNILKEHGLKTTRQRSEIVNILLNAEIPLCAEEIFRASENMSLSTVYRTLELLCERGVAKKENILDGDKMFYELADGKHRHYAVCLGCGELRHIDVCPVHDASVNGFTVTGHKLELYGYCKDCSGK
jgi:Fur family ferric uptake transcriptional regulator